MRERDIHPCFSCTLQDCDEASAKCELRKALNSVRNLRRRGDALSEIDRARFNIAYKEFYGRANDLRRREFRS